MNKTFLFTKAPKAYKHEEDGMILRSVLQHLGLRRRAVQGRGVTRAGQRGAFPGEPSSCSDDSSQYGEMP